ncbi:MAG TPA: hypothetical protein VK195_14320 [Burkholderiaceae bacterium]|nr:hypothetical protein [Burkholderiaceae bacterium]
MGEPSAKTEAVVHRQTPAQTWQAFCELRGVLDRQPNSRVVFSHLAILEQSLRCSIGSVPDYLPASFIERARLQLAEIAVEAEAPALRALLDHSLAFRDELSLDETPFADTQPWPDPEEADAQTPAGHLCPWPDTEVLEPPPPSPPSPPAPAPRTAGTPELRAWLPTLPMEG